MMVCFFLIGVLTVFPCLGQEKAVETQTEQDRWYDCFEFSGLIEVEAGYGTVDFNGPDAETEETSDLDLATVELNVDVKIVDHVKGHVLFKYEEEDLFVDEGYILFTGSENRPFYVVAGKQYIPFGCFDSHFISDPVTLVLGETNEGALVGGYLFGGERVDASLGIFNGRVNEIDSDDEIDHFVASVKVKPFENLELGVSYVSNLASSDAFSDQTTREEGISSYVSGWGAFASFSFLDRFRLIAEYIGALDEFEAGEVYNSADTVSRKPAAWNVELGVTLTDSLEVALKYEGSTDGDAGGGEFLPEARYGAVINWAFLEKTTLALEYLHGEYAEDFQTTETVTVQLAVES
jgi:hypothetical protein